ncbi:hypothetical protein CRUP_014810 [Coryphaenoides rupestris]|nr:hypothetical protein CRUP_014810 [Coryphaenoides rupestris]
MNAPPWCVSPPARDTPPVPGPGDKPVPGRGTEVSRVEGDRGVPEVAAAAEGGGGSDPGGQGSEVSGGPGGQGLDAVGVAGLAEHVAVQRCMRLAASTVKGTPSRLRWQTTQVKQWGWYAFPVARRMRSRMGWLHTVHVSRIPSYKITPPPCVAPTGEPSAPDIGELLEGIVVSVATGHI